MASRATLPQATRNVSCRAACVVCALVLALLATACASETPVVTSDENATTQPAPADEPVEAASSFADDVDESTSAVTNDAAPPNEAQSTVVVEAQNDLDTSAAAATDATADTTGSADAETADRPARPAAPNGRIAPLVAAGAQDLAAQVAAAEAGLGDPNMTVAEHAEWGHLHQVAIRKLGYEPDWDATFFEALPSELQARTLLHVSARRALIDLHSGYDAADFIPAWAIVDPEPPEALLSYYQEAEAATGIEWEYLAAINLIETGMGRIRGLSSAGAQGPMQFLPTTWAEAGIGEGDINNPRDAINAAARYLVRRGGPGDMPGAIWGYNNSDDYVTAVRSYAEILRQDASAYLAIYHWEIYFFTEAGDVWLPAGFRTDESIDLVDYLDANPWSTPDPGLR